VGAIRSLAWSSEAQFRLPRWLRRESTRRQRLATSSLLTRVIEVAKLPSSNQHMKALGRKASIMKMQSYPAAGAFGLAIIGSVLTQTPAVSSATGSDGRALVAPPVILSTLVKPEQRRIMAAAPVSSSTAPTKPQETSLMRASAQPPAPSAVVRSDAKRMMAGASVSPASAPVSASARRMMSNAADAGLSSELVRPETKSLMRAGER
jgi:hypothetical protein